jgi:hypothetical protein
MVLIITGTLFIIDVLLAINKKQVDLICTLYNSRSYYPVVLI